MTKLDKIKQRLEAHKDHTDVIFDKDAHTYHVLGEEFHGITSLIKKYKKPFDRDNISKGVAFRDGVSQEEILAEWDEKSTTALDYGNYVHDAYETLLNTGEITGAEKEITLIDGIMSSFGIEPLYGEYLMALREFKRASAIDILGWDGDKLVVCDLKTNKKGLTYEGYKNQKMLYPVNNLPDAKYYEYSLQISFYVYILKNMGFEVADDNYIVHIHKEECMMYPALNLENEVTKILAMERNI